MFKVRHGVFETNSSSMHSVSVRANGELLESYLNVGNDGYIHCSLGEFGWGIDNFWEQDVKLSYLLTMIYETSSVWDDLYHKSDDEKRSAFDNNEDFQKLNDEIIAYTNCPNGIYVDSFRGYIDHQSVEGYRCVRDFLKDWNIGSMTDFIFNDNVILHIDNDNH